jgi:large repetitive protein
VNTAFNTPVVVGLLANDTDPDGDPLTVVSETVPAAQGALTNAGGVWTFTPAAGFTGTATISYTMRDQDGATSSSTHDVVVGPNGNLPPTMIDPDPAVGTPSIDPANPNNLLVPAVDNVPLTLAAGSYFTDPNGDPLTITPDLTGAPAWLSYDPVTRIFTGTPPVDNTGAPVVIPVTVDDGKGGIVATTITIAPVNPGPTAVADTVNTAFNTPVVVGLLANDTDPDGDPLTVVSATVPAAQGTLTNAGGVWTFTPAAGFTGTATISYTMRDQDGTTSSSTHDVVVAGPGAAPVAANDIYTAPYGSPVSGNAAAGDTYPPGSTFVAVSQPLNGTLSFKPDGTFTYTANPDFVGTETFIYSVTDPAGRTVMAALPFNGVPIWVV